MRAAVKLIFLMSLLLGAGAGSATWAAAQTPNTEEVQNMKIRIRVGNNVLTGTLLNNKTARDFASLLPVTVSMGDLFGREKYGSIPRSLWEGGARSNRYEVGDIGYWSPGPDVAVYYKQDGSTIPSPGIIPIGKIDSGVEAFQVSGSLTITIELTK